MNWRRTIGLLLVAVGVAILTLKLGHVYDPAPTIGRLATKAGPKIANLIRSAGPDRVVYGALIILPICLGGLFLFLSSRSRTSAALVEKAKDAPLKANLKPVRKQAAIHSCNVLQLGHEARNLWQFEARNGGFALNREQTSLPGEPLPASLISKDWRSLWQRKLNIAWLPADRVFLRVAQLPLSEFNETLAMVELQMEKLSPMPVTQIAWSIQVLPHPAGNMQTVIVIIVARNVVEEFLGQLEGQGYLADALELPALDQLQATPITEDGAWIYPEVVGGKNTALTAWWYGGVLHNLDLVTLPPTERSASLKEQLTQMSWAGELEGWLSSPPRWHLVADPPIAAEWDPPLREGLEQDITVIEPRPASALAASTAQRAAHTDPKANLLPAEFSTRYQQQFVDRLWMRGLLAIAGLYVVGVVIYFIALQVALMRTHGIQEDVAKYSTQYTNAIQLEARLRVLKDRQDLKYAALDCWKTVAELMPESLTLESWNFSNGKKLSLSGSAPSGQAQEIINFSHAMRNATVNGQQLFDTRAEDDLNTRTIPNGINWNFSLELKRTEVQ